ncbi:MAG TPA: UbiA family prenyltransferase [Acetobacteraceae bacterium]|nr:UbiA family prenyltransferase [Acetobacteraceae bacterium]
MSELLHRVEAASTSQLAPIGLPLCIDLDGTLLRIDSLFEATFSAVLADWRVLFQLPRWLAEGRAHLKQELAARWEFVAAQLPYDQDVVQLIELERARGRRIVLCTAADERIANAVAAHLGLFDDVIASDGSSNLRGERKAAELCRRFGEHGFVYAGNDSTDYAVWRHAAAAVVVNAPSSVARTAAELCRVAATIDDRAPRMRAALRALRPYQWVKNVFTLVPLLAAGDFANGAGWRHSLAIMAAFCATASAIYLINDLSDLAADRAHPRKRLRPFASGALSLASGLAMVPVLFVLGAWLGLASGAVEALAVYAALSLGYTIRLKEQPLIDVFILAALYTIRLFGGGEASGHPVSMWLLGFSSFLFLSLALVKRVSELYRLQSAALSKTERRGYVVQDLPMLQMFGCASSFASAVVLSLYVQSDTALHAYARPSMLWGVIPLLLFWQCRLWLSASRGYMNDDPIVYAARDWVSWLVFAGVVGVAVAAWLPV